MRLLRIAAALGLVVVMAYGAVEVVFAGQVWVKCDITCRCLSDGQIGNFTFVIPVDKSPDLGYDADSACKSYGHRVCSDGCNGLKFSYTYQVTGP